MAAPEDPVSEQQLKKKAVDLFVAATPPVGAPIEDWRAGFERLCENFAIPPDAKIEPVNADGVRALKVTAAGASPAHLLIHFHSGGYIMGSANAYRNFACRLSRVTGATVIVPDYRLAPEHVYPAAIDDALSTYRWCLKSWQAGKIVLSGDSAGGGLSIATLLALRDAGTAMPAGAIAISPLLDLAAEGESIQYNKKTDPLIDGNMVVEIGKVYIGTSDPHQLPLASPLWGQHHGLPPLLLMVSGSEVIRDDAVRLAASVRKAGGLATLYLPDDMVHIWTLFPFLSETTRSMNMIGSFARERLGLGAGG
jgi:acetyl esterase/lipase